ncbi:MAG: FAD binding domain-containing protein [Nitrososphaeria archaeon]
MQVIMAESLKNALKEISENQDAAIIANGTDMLPRIRDEGLKVEKILDISALDRELSYIKVDGNSVRIGAMTTVTEIENSSEFRGSLNAFYEVASKFGGPQVRNRATIGGNICAASSSEDFIPLLMVLDAGVVVQSINGKRTIKLDNFITGKRTVARRNDEILVEVQFSKPGDDYRTGFEKVGRRNILIINLVNMAMAMSLRQGKISDVRIALNRVSGKVPGRARLTEGFLRGKEVKSDVLESAREKLGEELRLTSDFRASSEYRVHLAQAILEKLLNRLAGGSANE